MGVSLLGVRPPERRVAFAAFATLAGLVASQEIMSAARDALFLTRLPASQLPWVVLATAVLGGAIAYRWQGSFARARSLAITALVGAVMTASMWGAAGSGGTWVPYAIYVWVGLFATFAITQLWMLLGAVYTVTEAKRVFAAVGLGGILGGIAGSAVARALAEVVSARDLLLVAAAILAASAAGPLLLARAAPTTDHRRLSAERTSARDCLDCVREHAYGRRLAALGIAATVVTVFADYTFKSVAAARVVPEELAAFFATVNLVVGIASLVAQLLLVPWLLRSFGVTRAASLLPLLVLGGATWIAAGGGLVAAMLMQGTDRSLRHSLHRTVSELLFMPLPDTLRRGVKMFVDVIGLRVGQACASLAILATIALVSPPAEVFAGATAVIAFAWLFIAVGIGERYLDMFRATLHHASVGTRVQLPEIDLSSLESVVAALNSSKDEEVLAALSLLEDRGKLRLVPDVLLYHPSPQVVVQTMNLLVRSGRDSLLPIAKRLGAHPDPRVRAAALRACLAVRRDDGELRAALSDLAPEVRAVAVVELGASSSAFEDEANAAAQRLIGGGPDEQWALAHAIRERPSAAFATALITLSRAADSSVRAEAARAMSRSPLVRFTDSLTELLASRETREAAREALVAIGAKALAHLDRTLADPAVRREVRHHIPRTISRFPATDAAPLMLARLVEESDGVVRHKLLRGLGRLRADHPELQLDGTLLSETTRRALVDGFQVLHWRSVLEEGMRLDPSRHTIVGELLISVLRDHEVKAIERVMRLLGLCYPKEDFERIHRGLRDSNRRLQATSRELLAAALAPPLRGAVLALVDDTPATDRIAAAAELYTPGAREASGVLAEILGGAGESLRCAAACHAAELGLEALREPVAQLRSSPSPFLREVAVNADARFESLAMERVHA
ncbi:MAG: hypothetical protein AB7T06_10075 [Kofleriaceae bacterium]